MQEVKLMPAHGVMAVRLPPGETTVRYHLQSEHATEEAAMAECARLTAQAGWPVDAEGYLVGDRGQRQRWATTAQLWPNANKRAFDPNNNATLDRARLRASLGVTTD